MYKPLAQNERIIRLLTLRPGSGEISCRLTECPLEDARGGYKALSYTWEGGIGTVQKFIHCDELGKIGVMPNLYAVLRRLRHATDAAILWIDLLCIDQNNTEERTHQVGMMRDIYANSTEVIVWLGSGSETDASDQPIIEFWDDGRDLQHISSYQERMYSQKQGTLSLAFAHRTDMYGTFCIIWLLAQGLQASKIWWLRKPDYAPEIVHGLSSLLEMPWWTRIWVVQETVVASRAVVYYNNISMPWDIFSRAASQISRHSVEMLGPTAARTYGPTLSRFHRQISEIDGTRDSWSAVEPSALLPLLRKFRNRGVSDPRDKVFALLGLVKYWGGSAPLVPDYDHGLPVVYLETTKHLIRSHKSLGVLSGAKASTKQLGQGFPTWLTDWSHVAPAGEADRLSAQHLYKAAGDAVEGIRLHGHALLEVGGHCVDRIFLTFSSEGDPENRLRSTSSDGDPELRSIIQKWWSSLPLPAHAYYEDGVHGTITTVEDAFWRTICANLIYVPNAVSDKNKFRRAKSPDAVLFNSWYTDNDFSSKVRRTSIVHGMFIEGRSDEELKAEQRSLAFHRSVECAARGRRFFVTEAGRMGLGPETCKPGDEVYLLSGSRVPMILRASGRTKKCRGKLVERLVLSAEEQNTRIVAGQPGAARNLKDIEMAKETRCGKDHLNCFALVGDAYVHGIMDGSLASRDATAPVYLR